MVRFRQAFVRIGNASQAVWSIIGVVVFLAIVLFFLGSRIGSMHKEVYHEHATSEAYADAQEQYRQKCLSLTTTREVATCFDEVIKSSRETQRAEEDLYAQKRMAAWAEWMFYATFLIGVVSVFVTTAGVFPVRRTLDLQRTATEAATEAAKASVEANRLNREGFIADQRPWLSVEVVVTGPLKPDPYGMRVGIEFTLKNFGKPE